MPLYHRFHEVKTRLAGKVRFAEDGDDPQDSDKMPLSLARKLMDEAEGIVEQDLSPRYLAPFQTDAGAPYSQLPARPTRNNITVLCELQSCILILATDFGRGSAVNGSNYCESLEKIYKNMVDEKLLKRRDEEKETQWFYPPLPSLRLNWHNTECDDGYSGMAMNTSDGESFAPHQINDPGANFWNPCDSDHVW